MTLRGTLFGLLALRLGSHGVAWACSCIEDPVAADLVASGDPIVLAEVVDVGSPGCGRGRPVPVSVRVLDTLAGPEQPATLVVQDHGPGDSCGLRLAEGQLWVLQPFSDESWVSACTASRRVDGPDDPWVEELRAAAAAAP